MARITIHVTQTGLRATEILADVADYLGTDFVRLDRNHGYFAIEGPGSKRAFTKVRAAFDAVSKDWYHYFVINYPDA
jgi:hypothetical protein